MSPSRLTRRRVVPADVAAALPLERGESALAAAADPEGRWYVGTERALLMPVAASDGTNAASGPGEADVSYERLPWENVERAEWDGEREQLVVVEAVDFGERRPVRRVALTEPGRLLQLIRERVTASIVVKFYQPVDGDRGIEVVGRRSPHSAGEVTWSFVIDPRLDAGSPEVRRAARHGLAEARGQIGA